MVHTRSGHKVVHMEASYGRAARTESKRRLLKRKLDSCTARVSSNEFGMEGNTMTPRRTTRAQIQVEEDLATPPSASNRVAATPPPRSERLLRRRLPTCSDFGPTRHFAFQGQGFFFCNPCDLWDARLPDCSAKGSRVSTRFACTAHHNCFSHPTSIRNEHCRSSDYQTEATKGTDSMHETDSCQGRQNLSTASHSTSSADEFDRNDDNASEGEGSSFNPHSSWCSVGTPTSRSSRNSSRTLSNEPEENVVLRLVHGEEEQQQEDAIQQEDTIQEEDAANEVNNQPAQAENVIRLLHGDEHPEVNRLKGKIALLRQKIRDMTRKNKRLQAATVGTNAFGPSNTEDPTISRNKAFKHQVTEAINEVLRRYPRWSPKRTGALVAQALWEQAVNLPELLKLSRKYFQEKVFTPFNVLREMDLAGGTLSYEGIDVLRRVETAGLKRFRGSMIPLKSEIKRMAGMVEWFAHPRCPFELKQTSKGESVEFDYAKSMLCIIQAFHLDQVGKIRSLSVASSIDGASLSKNLSIIAGGIKIIDRGARCPLTRKPLLDNPTTMKAQSRNLCIPLKLMMGRETKETFAHFATLFEFLDQISDAKTLPPEMAGFMPFGCMTNCDLSAQWKGLCKGGAAKVHTLPCTGCATESDCLATPNAGLCTRWCYEHSLVDPEWMCFHKAMATPERVSTIKAEVAELLLALGGALDKIKADSQMTSNDVDIESPLVSSTTDAASIHFIPKTALEKQSFSRLLSNELMLRSLDNGGSIETRRESLRHSLLGEATIVRLSKEIAHGEVKEGAYFLLMNTLPCVLHMENRNGIKLLTMILIEGLSNAKKKLLYMDVNAKGTRVIQFVADIERIINRSMIGSEDDPCQWMCPFDAKKKEICPITMDNVRTRRIVDSLDTLVDFCVTDESRASLWITSLNNYRTAMILLRKRDDFTNTEIASYQNHANKFFQAWVRLWQKEGITNYIHMIGSGHIAEYLYKWRNLYRYSQQGWEAMNSLVKTFFFRRTSHGGGVRGDSKRSRLVPIARWLQRRLVFLCRTTEGSIRQYAEANPMPKVYRSQATLLDNDIYE